ncbi:hypothetical protein BVX98_04215 [bacterium F11]|nr:hypothetical protein BVX98_04215 [bacterium F11]
MKNRVADLILGIGLSVLLIQATYAKPPESIQTPDRLVLDKSKRNLVLLKGKDIIKSYKVALGGNPKGRKVEEGDQKTPEGTYIVDWVNYRSKYHKSLHISYPSSADKKRASERGVHPGGDIMIHGIKNGYGWLGRFHRLMDWTDGCIAVTNQEIEEMLNLVPIGTKIEIVP